MDPSDSNRLRYEQWVRCHAPELYRYAYRLTGRRQVAEDLLQETFVEAWRCVAKQKEPGRARAWLFQILRYRYAHYCRDNQRHRQTAGLGENTEGVPPDRQPQPLTTLAERDALQAALNVLSPAMRQTFLMVFLEGRTCRETAQILGIPLGTVLSRLDSARQSLRSVLGDPRSSPRRGAAERVEGEA